MIDFASALTIVGMSVITYSTRLIGYFTLRNRRFGPRAVRVMDAAPGCVIAAVIAPHFVSGKPDEHGLSSFSPGPSRRHGSCGTAGS